MDQLPVGWNLGVFIVCADPDYRDAWIVRDVDFEIRKHDAGCGSVSLQIVPGFKEAGTTTTMDFEIWEWIISLEFECVLDTVIEGDQGQAFRVELFLDILHF